MQFVTRGEVPLGPPRLWASRYSSQERRAIRLDGVVEMFRDAAERHGRDRFSCSLPVWRFLRDLGVTFGWQPCGTTYSAVAKPEIDLPARHDYQPGDARDRKYVDADDAIAWANALEAAKRSSHSAAMIDAAADGASMEAPLRSLIDEFIAYAYGGAFAFAISPASARS